MFIVLRNYCTCHPETCCCDKYAIIAQSTGEKVATAYDKPRAIKLADLLNKKVNAK